MENPSHCYHQACPQTDYEPTRTFRWPVDEDIRWAADDVPVDQFRHGQVVVIDIANLHTDIQAVVIARTLKRLLDVAEDQDSYIGVDHLVVWVDELNTYAPSTGSDYGAVKRVLQLISKQGRYAGVSLWGAAQALSRVDELVRANAATRALGVTTDTELASGAYGRLERGLTERLATLPKGQIGLWHYSYRNAMIVKFPRPAWQMGMAKKKDRRKRSTPKTSMDTLRLTELAKQRLLEGIPEDVAERIIAEADDPKAALIQLQKLRSPDMRRQALVANNQFSEEDPMEMGGDVEITFDDLDDFAGEDPYAL